MSKIKIKAFLKNDKETHVFDGKGIKKNNQLIYLDGKVQTTVIIDDMITIKRRDRYELELNFKKGMKSYGKYINEYGNFEFEVETIDLVKTNNSLKIAYKLKDGDYYINTFTYNLEFTLDT